MLDRIKELLQSGEAETSEIAAELERLIDAFGPEDPIVSEAFFMVEQKRYESAGEVWLDKIYLKDQNERFEAAIRELREAAEDPSRSNMSVQAQFWKSVSIGIRDLSTFERLFKALESRPIISLNIVAQATVMGETISLYGREAMRRATQRN